MHLFDEPQFNTQDGYIGFMLDFFRALRGEGRLVFLCLHPNEPFHLEILRESCERFVFVDRGRLTHAPAVARGARVAPISAACHRCATLQQRVRRARPLPSEGGERSGRSSPVRHCRCRARYSGSSVK